MKETTRVKWDKKIMNFPRKRISLEETFNHTHHFDQQYSQGFIQIMERALHNLNHLQTKRSPRRVITEEYQTFVSSINPTESRRAKLKLKKPRHMSTQSNKMVIKRISPFLNSPTAVDSLFKPTNILQNKKFQIKDFSHKKSQFPQSKNAQIRIRLKAKTEFTEKQREIIYHDVGERSSRKKEIPQQGMTLMKNNEVDFEPIKPWAIRQENEVRDKIFYDH